MMGLLDQMRTLISAMLRNSMQLSAKKGVSRIDHYSKLLNMQGGSILGFTKVSLVRLPSFLGTNLLLLGTDIWS